MRCLVLSLMFSLATVLSASAQSPTSNWGLSIDMSQGTTIKHRETMVFTLPKPARDLRLEAIYQTAGKQAWHRLHRFPRIGAGAMLLSYGNAEVLGRVFVLYGFIDEPFIQKGKFTLFGRFDHGLSWHSKIFHPDDNPLNNAIGSRINVHASLGLRGNYQLNQQLALRLGMYFTHQSNSRISVPNLGLNSARAVLGLSIHPSSAPAARMANNHQDFSLARWQRIAKLSLGLKEEKVVHGPTYPVYIFGFQAARTIKHKRRILIGAEALWDMANEHFKRNQDIGDENQNFQTFKPSLTIGHEHLFGHIGLLTQANFYLRNPFQDRKFWAAKFGSNIYLYSNFSKRKQNAFVGMYIKTHYFVADFLEFALGYQF